MFFGRETRRTSPHLEIEPLFNDGSNGRTSGGHIGKSLYLLPCTNPGTIQDELNATSKAIAAVLAYRQRTSTALPEWVHDFRFRGEIPLLGRQEELQLERQSLDEKLDGYRDRKAALALQSDPLVRAVQRVLDDPLGILIESDEKCIEDAVLRDGDEVVAVFEIKGVKRDFKRKDVNQVDSHRERLELPTTTPGVLIINTYMAASSVKEKDQYPHPIIIKKAVADNVLLVRTLDLLRYADLVEQGILTKEEFRRTLLNERGWLKVTESGAEIVGG